MRPGMILWVAIVGQAFGPGSEGCGGLSSDAVDFGGRVLHPATLRRSELAGLGCTTRVGGAGWGVRGAARLRGGGIDGEQETAVKQDGGDQDAHDPDERAMDVWDVASGPVKFPPGFFERPGAEDLTGLDAEYTMFRHRRTGAAVEIVHDDDDDDIPGFFRMLSAFIFKTKASSKITANFAEDCPGYVVFANAHCTGDFFKATNLYHSLAADPGAQPFSEAALLGGNWTVESEDDGAGRRVLAHSASNWTLRTSGPYLILHHRVCLGAQLVFTADGFVFLGSHCPRGYLVKAPSAIVMTGTEERELLTVAEAKARLQSNFLLADPDPALLKPLRESRLRDYLHTVAGVKGGFPA